MGRGKVPERASEAVRMDPRASESKLGYDEEPEFTPVEVFLDNEFEPRIDDNSSQNPRKFVIDSNKSYFWFTDWDEGDEGFPHHSDVLRYMYPGDTEPSVAIFGNWEDTYDRAGNIYVTSTENGIGEGTKTLLMEHFPSESHVYYGYDDTGLTVGNLQEKVSRTSDRKLGKGEPAGVDPDDYYKQVDEAYEKNKWWDDDPFAEEEYDEVIDEEAQYEEKILNDFKQDEKSELYRIIMDAGGIQTGDLREEYQGIPNTFKRRDGLRGDEMAEYLSTYHPEYGIQDERSLIDAMTDRYRFSKSAAKGNFLFIIEPDGSIIYDYWMSTHEKMTKGMQSEDDDTYNNSVKGWVEKRDMYLYPNSYTENGPSPARMNEQQIKAAINEIPKFETGGHFSRNAPVVDIEHVTLEFTDYEFEGSFEEFVEQFSQTSNWVPENMEKVEFLTDSYDFDKGDTGTVNEVFDDGECGVEVDKSGDYAYVRFDQIRPVNSVTSWWKGALDYEGGENHQQILDQNAGTHLEGLPGAVNVPGYGRLQFGAHGELQNLADQYSQTAGIGNDRPSDYLKVNPDTAAQIAQEYDQLEHNPNDPEVQASYNAMIQETLDQYNHLVENGYTFEFYPDYDPYPNSPREAVLDLHNNKHMFVYPTEAGFGSTEEDEYPDHPLMGDSGIRWNDKPVTYNDLFRAVHDVYGHAKEGVGFRADGEDNAYRQHSNMYSELARGAMAAETRGQNSWVNFGPHGETNQTATTGETVFAPQKATILPEWAQDPNLHAPQVQQTYSWWKGADWDELDDDEDFQEYLRQEEAFAQSILDSNKYQKGERVQINVPLGDITGEPLDSNIVPAGTEGEIIGVSMSSPGLYDIDFGDNIGSSMLETAGEPIMMHGSEIPISEEYLDEVADPLEELWKNSRSNMNIKQSSWWKRAVDQAVIEYVRVDGEEYHSAISKAVETSEKVREFVHVYQPEEYDQMKAFLSSDGLSGYAIKPDGDIVSLFSLEKGRGDQMVGEAISNGGVKLDAFDGYLPEFYGRHGFEEYDREDNWTPGGPDVVYMRHKGASMNWKQADPRFQENDQGMYDLEMNAGDNPADWSPQSFRVGDEILYLPTGVEGHVEETLDVDLYHVMLDNGDIVEATPADLKLNDNDGDGDTTITPADIQRFEEDDPEAQNFEDPTFSLSSDWLDDQVVNLEVGDVVHAYNCYDHNGQFLGQIGEIESVNGNTYDVLFDNVSGTFNREEIELLEDANPHYRNQKEGWWKGSADKPLTDYYRLTPEQLEQHRNAPFVPYDPSAPRIEQNPPDKKQKKPEDVGIPKTPSNQLVKLQELPDHEEMVSNVVTAYKWASPEQLEGGVIWYDEARSEAQKIVDTFSSHVPGGVSIEQVVGVQAVISPNLSWEKNIMYPAFIVRQYYLEGIKEPTLWREDETSLSGDDKGYRKKMAIMNTNRGKAVAILEGAEPSALIEAPKTNSFYHNIIGETDEQKDRVTVDLWATRIAMGSLSVDSNLVDPISGELISIDGPADTKAYNAIEQAYLDATERINAERNTPRGTEGYLYPRDIQAVTWVVYRDIGTHADVDLSTPPPEGVDPVEYLQRAKDDAYLNREDRYEQDMKWWKDHEQRVKEDPSITPFNPRTKPKKDKNRLPAAEMPWHDQPVMQEFINNPTSDTWKEMVRQLPMNSTDVKRLEDHLGIELPRLEPHDVRDRAREHSQKTKQQKAEEKRRLDELRKQRQTVSWWTGASVGSVNEAMHSIVETMGYLEGKNDAVVDHLREALSNLEHESTLEAWWKSAAGLGDTAEFLIEQVYEGVLPIDEAIKEINDMILTVEDPKDTFELRSRLKILEEMKKNPQQNVVPDLTYQQNPMQEQEDAALPRAGWWDS